MYRDYLKRKDPVQISLEFTAALAKMKERTDGIANTPEMRGPGKESGLQEEGGGSTDDPAKGARDERR